MTDVRIHARTNMAEKPRPRDEGRRSRVGWLDLVAAGVVTTIAIAAGIVIVTQVEPPSDDEKVPIPVAVTSTNTTVRENATPTVTPTPPIAPPSATVPLPHVIVLNDSDVIGLADTAKNRVTEAGFTVDRVGNYVDIYDIPETTVYYDPGHEAAAQQLFDAVHGIRIIKPRADTAIESTGTLILVVTRDFLIDRIGQ